MAPGYKIKMTLESAKPKGKEARWRMVKPRSGLAGLVLPLSKCLVTGIPSLIGSSWEKEYPSLTMIACDGLSWDTPAGI